MASISAVKEKVQKSNDVVDIPIMDGAGDPYTAKDGSQATIGVVGRDSEHYRRETAKLSRAVQKMPRVEQDKVDWRRSLAACGVIRWHGWDDDAPFPCTSENVMALLADSDILEQVEAGIRDHARFFTKGSPS